MPTTRKKVPTSRPSRPLQAEPPTLTRVNLRREDFGRRRALGVTRTTESHAGANTDNSPDQRHLTLA